MLTPTQTDLQCLALTAFFNNGAIGYHMNLERSTVRWRLQRCYRFLKIPADMRGEHRRALAVMLAISKGLLTWNYMAQIERRVHHAT